MKYIRSYVSFLKPYCKFKRKIRVVFDSSDGTTGLVLKELFKKNPKIQTKFLNAKPNGNFPAHGPDPLGKDAVKRLGKTVEKLRADCGVIFDADGDRVFFIDNEGEIISPEHAAILIGKKYKGNIILDLRVGYLAREWFKEKRRTVVNSRIGHFFIKKLMRKKKISYAAELTGHYYFKDFFYSDSGIFATIRLLNSVSGLDISLREWIDSIPNYYQSGEVNFRVKNKERIMARIEKKYRARAKKINKVDGVRMEFGSKEKEWWFIVRPSNTEDMLRLVLEARDKRVFQSELKALKKEIKKSF